MATKKPASTPPPAPSYTVTNCQFTSNPSPEVSEMLITLAEAAKENAIAIQKIAVAIKGPDSMLRIGN